MNISTLPANPSKQHSKKRLGRGIGSGRGKTATRGTKGSGARTGERKRPGFEGGRTPLLRRLPKRGFIRKDTGRELPFQVVNVGDLARCGAGTAITPSVLEKAGLIRNATARVKLLGTGEVTAAVRISVHAVSESAKEKIEKAGGSVTLITSATND
jgi:large subunit ribosomal protein L15